jgi:hypothetical protein
MSYCVTHDVEWDDKDEEEAKEALNHNEEAGCEVVAKRPADKTDKEETFPATKSKTESR